MLNKQFIGMITSVAAGIITEKDKDGTKIKSGVYKVKLESANIDYEEMAKFNPNITATLLNIQPAIMKSVNFGDQSAFRMQLNLFAESQELFENKDLEASFGNVLIKNLTVKIVEQIPIYIFSLEIGMMSDGRFLFKNIKQRISFEFAEMEKAE